MAKYKVKVEVSYLKELEIYASNEDQAESKANEIVRGWNNVHDVDVLDVIEV